MSAILVVPLDRPDARPCPISAKLRTQLNYFAAAPDESSGAGFVEGEFWFDLDSVRRWLDDGVIYLVSPLDTANMTEVELSEEQETFLGWLQSSGVRHVRIQEERSPGA